MPLGMTDTYCMLEDVPDVFVRAAAVPQGQPTRAFGPFHAVLGADSA